MTPQFWLGFVTGCAIGSALTSACWVAFMIYIANRSGAKVGE